MGRFMERIRTALPVAISDAFGGGAEIDAVEPGALPQLVMELDSSHHLHLEIEVAHGRTEPRNLVLVLRAEDGERLFGLEPTPVGEYADPETQLRVLAEFTEGAEALAATFANALATLGVSATLRVSGASLEEADASPIAASLPLGSGDIVALSAMLTGNGEPMPLVIAASSDLAATLGDIEPTEPEPVMVGAPPRVASFAEQARRRAAAADSSPIAPPAQAVPNVTAHAVQFGQLDPPASASRTDRGVDLILDGALKVRVELGSTQMTVEEVLALGPGSVVELDRLAGEPVDIVINDRLIARGEVVVVEENFGVRVTEIITTRARTG
jgi:flagellar motor switch protein FliN